MDTCNVRGCTGAREVVFLSGKGAGLSRREWLVCEFDLRRLELGAPWTADSASNEIVMSGDGAPLDVLDYKVFISEGSPIIALDLGRDDVKEQTIDLRISPKDLQDICRIVTKSEHA